MGALPKPTRKNFERFTGLLAETRRRLEIRACEQGTAEAGPLLSFVKLHWHILEPVTPFVDGWALKTICEHLEAVTAGKITRLLINVPPGPMRDDSVVETSRGPVPLKNVSVGDLVLTHKGRYRHVEAVHQQGVLPILRITTNSGRVTHAAPTHPYLTPRGWVDASELKVGDRLAVVNPIEDRAKSEVTPEAARLLGYMIGDGSLTNATMSFTNQDEDTLADFEHCLRSVGLASKHVKRGNHTLVRLHGGQKVRDFFDQHGVTGCNSYQKRIPPQILAADRETVRNFIGAYWSCDGMIEVRSTRERGSIYRSSCTTVSKGLADDLLYALGMIGIEGRLRRKERALETARQPGGRYVSFNIEIQKETFAALFANMPGLCARKNALANQCRATFDQVLWHDDILAIEEGEPANCMCLTVADDHSFVCSGVAVKNSMKSLLTNVFWPAWEWGPMRKGHKRLLSFSYASHLTERDNAKFRDLICHPDYQRRFGDRFKVTKAGEVKVGNDKTGWKIASSVGGVSTGERADTVTCDDAHNVKQGESDAIRTSTVEWFSRSMSNRLNNMETSAIVVIMQRVHEDDVSGHILAHNLGYEHLMIAAEFDGRRVPTCLGWTDPRTEDGEIFWPERFSPLVLSRQRVELGPYAWSGQYQQIPTPAGGGILKRDWWQVWDDDAALTHGVEPGKYPKFSFIVASLDSAYTEKETNDPSALTVWGVWQDRHGVLRLMLVSGWADHLDFPKLVDKVTVTCKTYRVSKILIEAKASGISVAQELRSRWLTLARELGVNPKTQDRGDFGVQLVNPTGKGDKVARAHAVVPLFAAGLVFAPDKVWADKVIDQCAQFPKAPHDDYVDTVTQALSHLRTIGLAVLPDERQVSFDESVQHKARLLPLYES